MRTVCLLLAALCGAACARQAADAVDPAVVAVVNGEPLSRAEFAAELARELRSSDPVEPRRPEQVEPYRAALLETLVDRTLLLQAARKLDVSVAPEEVDRRVMRLASDYSEGIDGALAQGQLSMAELKRRTHALLTIERLFDEHVYPRVAVTEDEIRAHFEAHRERYAEPEQVRAAQIVVRGMDEARRVQAQLRAGKKFPDLARRYSLSADARVGGDLGFFARGVMPPQFDEVAFRLSVGQVSDVVSTEYGYHLFKVLDKRPARTPELAELHGKIEASLLAQKRARAQAEYVKGLRDGAQVTVNAQVLQSVGTEPIQQSSAAR